MVTLDGTGLGYTESPTHCQHFRKDSLPPTPFRRVDNLWTFGYKESMSRTDARTVLAESKQRWQTRGMTVTNVARFVGVSMSELARRTGMRYATLHDRMHGKSLFQPFELDAIAAALGLQPDLFELEPDDAVRWLLDHPEVTRGCLSEEQPIAPSRGSAKGKRPPRERRGGGAPQIAA